MNHICLEVEDLNQVTEILATRKLPEGIQPAKPIQMGLNNKRQINYFDLDGTRIEIMEANTFDGKPAPSSYEPPPVFKK